MYEARALNCRSLSVGWLTQFLDRGWKFQNILWLSLGLLSSGAGWWWVSNWLGDPSRATEPFRVGYIDTPPYNTVAADGSPKGPYIDLFNQACRRLRIPIEWVYAPEGAEVALKS